MANREYRNISADKAKELLKSGKAKYAKGSGMLDWPSILISIGFSVVVFISVTVYVELFVDTRIIKDFNPQQINTDSLESVTINSSEIIQAIELKEFGKADSLINLSKNEHLNESQSAYLGFVQIELKLANHRYNEALELTRSIQSLVLNNQKDLTTLLWLRAHSYYYLKKYLEAHEQFSVIVQTGDIRYQESAKEYQQKIYDLIRTDGLNAFIE